MNSNSSSTYLQGNAGKQVPGLLDLNSFDNPYEMAPVKDFDWSGSALNTLQNTFSGGVSGGIAFGPVGAGIGAGVGLATGLWDMFSGSSAQDEANKKAKEYNATVEAEKAHQTALKSQYNKSILSAWEKTTANDNLKNYMTVVGTPETDSYQTI